MELLDQGTSIASSTATVSFSNITCIGCNTDACGGVDTTDSDERSTILVVQIVLFGAALLLNATVVTLPVLKRVHAAVCSPGGNRDISAALPFPTPTGSISSILGGRLGETYQSQVTKRRRAWAGTTANVGTIMVALVMLVESCVMFPLLHTPGKSSYVCALNITYIIVHCSVTFGYTLVIGIHGVSSTMYLVYAMLPMRSANRSPIVSLKLTAAVWVAATVLTVATLAALLTTTSPSSLCNGSNKTLALIYSTSLSATKSKVCSWANIICFSYIILAKVSIIIVYFKSTRIRSHFRRWPDIIWFQIFQVVQFLSLSCLMAYDIAADVDTDNCWQIQYIVKDFTYRLIHIIYTITRPIFAFFWLYISRRSERRRSLIYSSVATIGWISGVFGSGCAQTQMRDGADTTTKPERLHS